MKYNDFDRSDNNATINPYFHLKNPRYSSRGIHQVKIHVLYSYTWMNGRSSESSDGDKAGF